MFKLDHIKSFAIILIYFTPFVWSQDWIFVSDVNLTETRSNSTQEIHTIPETLLIQLKNIRNASQLLRFLGSDDDDDDDTLLLGPSIRNGTETARRGLSSAAAATITQPANCQTQQQVIEIDKPENGATVYWPSCVRIRRCGGCCTSKMLECKPITTSIVNVTVLQMRYNPGNPGNFENQGTRVFSLEQHNRCACACKEGPKDCDPVVHEYRANECRCVCKRIELAAFCTGLKKIWDNKNCFCKCRNVEMCSSGRIFNIFTCRCEIFRRSLATTYFKEKTSNASLGLQVSDNSP